MRIVVVTGPPCAGKTHYVHQHRGPDDVVIDFDALADALGYPHEHVSWPPDDHPARTVALRARASALRAAAETEGDHTVWIVSTHAGPRTLNVHEVIELDPGIDVCNARAAERPGDLIAAHAEIADWYAWRAATAPTGSRSW